eukprot:346254-Pelagomonas_calceolata.AAC.16
MESRTQHRCMRGLPTRTQRARVLLQRQPCALINLHLQALIRVSLPVRERRLVVLCSTCCASLLLRQQRQRGAQFREARSDEAACKHSHVCCGIRGTTPSLAPLLIAPLKGSLECAVQCQQQHVAHAEQAWVRCLLRVYAADAGVAAPSLDGFARGGPCLWVLCMGAVARVATCESEEAQHLRH